MEVKKVRKLNNKKLVKFTNKVEVLVPYRYDIKKGMKLKLSYENAFIDINDEFVNIFTLSNNETNFNLFINDNTEYEDRVDLLSSFISYGELDKEDICSKSPIEDLVKALNEDDDYYNSWVANLAMGFMDSYNFAKDKTNIHKIANDSADNFLKQLTYKRRKQ